MSDHLTERAEIEERFADASTRHFGERAAFVISSGSFAYAGAEKGRSDLDVMTVFKSDVYQMSRSELADIMSGFIEDYIKIHKEYGYRPDPSFPGEYITEANVEDAIAGRGFHASDTGLFLPPASNEYYLEDPNRYYRAWLSMLAFSRRLHGDKNKFEEIKLRAWESIMLFLLSQFDEKKIDTNKVLRILTGQEDKWQGVGVTKKCVTFPDEERLYVEQTLVRLNVRGILGSNRSGKYAIDKARIGAWSSAVSEALRANQLHRSAFLLSKEDELSLAGFAGLLIDEEKPQASLALETERYSASPMKNRFLGDCTQIVYTADKDDQKRDGLTDPNILIFVKTTENPLGVKSENGKLFSKDHFKGAEILLRVSSACLHGSLGDTECNCYQESLNALSAIGTNGCGIFVYMPQDALGRGLRDKVRDHRLLYGVNESGQSISPMTVEESLSTLHPEGYDVRGYSTLRRAFEELGLADLDFTFLGENEKKVHQIRSETGFSIVKVMNRR